MSITHTHPNTKQPHSMAGEFVSLGAALKLISPFSGD